MSQNPFRWVEIYVQDIPRAKAFYESVFQFKLEALPNPNPTEMEIEMWAFPMSKDTPGASGALVKMASVPSGGCGTVAYFGSADCSVEEGRIKKAGGSIHRSKFSIGQYGFIVLALDTEGNMIGVHSVV